MKLFAVARANMEDIGFEETVMEKVNFRTEAYFVIVAEDQRFGVFEKFAVWRR